MPLVSVDAKLTGVSPAPEKTRGQEPELPAQSGGEQGVGTGRKGLNSTSAEGREQVWELFPLKLSKPTTGTSLGSSRKGLCPEGIRRRTGRADRAQRRTDRKGERCLEKLEEKCKQRFLVGESPGSHKDSWQDEAQRTLPSPAHHGCIGAEPSRSLPVP